jgi:formylglycine-generating enzyme required for sulfatase activity
MAWSTLHGTQTTIVAKWLVTRAGLDWLSPCMQEILPGTFKIGDLLDHNITFQRPFRLGLYEVTFAEYDLYAAITGATLPNDAGWGREHRPVINVSWDDAHAYTVWLSKQTGKHFRLPTEAEWEYAARSEARMSSN